MKSKLMAAMFILITVAISPIYAQAIHPQQNSVIQPIGPSPVQGMTAPPIQGMARPPIAPQNGAITAQQPSVAAQPQQGLGNVGTLGPGQTIFVPAGSIIIESLPGFTPGSFITAPTAPVTSLGSPLPTVPIGLGSGVAIPGK